MLSKLILLYKKYLWPAAKYATYLGVKTGDNCSIATREFGSEPYLIEIGNHVQITAGVKFFTHGGAWVFRNKYPNFDFFGKTVVGNNVYIGNNALILPGVTIGNNVIIGAGAVVTKSIQDGMIVGGNPAKVIGNLEDYYQKIAAYNLDTKGMDFVSKKKFLLSQPNSKFIKK